MEQEASEGRRVRGRFRRRPGPRRSQNAHRNAFILIGLGGATVTAFGLAAIAGIFAPVFLGVVLTICVHPLRVWLEKRGVPRGIGTASVIIAVVLLLAGLGYAMLVAFGQFGALLQEFSDQIAAIGQDVAAWLSSIGIGADEINDIFAGFDPAALVAFIGGLIGGLTGWFSLLVIVFTMVMLMAMDAAFVPTVLKQLYPARPLAVASLVGYSSNVRRYMVATTVLGVAQGVVDWLALTIIGVPGAFIWGLLAFVCSFIPNIGYFIALIPPIIFGALVGRLADGDHRHRRLRRHQRHHPVGDPAARHRQGREPEPDDHLLLGAVLGRRGRPDRGDPRDPAHAARAHGPRGLQPGDELDPADARRGRRDEADHGPVRCPGEGRAQGPQGCEGERRSRRRPTAPRFRVMHPTMSSRQFRPIDRRRVGGTSWTTSSGFAA